MPHLDRTIHIWNAGSVEEVTDHLAIEEPLEIVLAYEKNGKSEEHVFAITMRSPGDDANLVTGLLFAEGIITNKDDVLAISGESNLSNRIKIRLSNEDGLKHRHWERSMMTNSSCGVCGKSSLDFIGERGVYIHRRGWPKLGEDTIFSLADTLKKQQSTFGLTGGAHASALFDMKGHIISIKEDVGRHNALDKLIGSAIFSEQLPLKEHGVLLSGRASFELIQKAHMAGIPIVLSIGAPSSLAVELADETGMTLIGFVKPRKFNIYNDQSRFLHEGS